MPFFRALLVAIMFVAPQPAECAGSVVLVTGASSGIGLVASKYFAKQGLRVVLTARRSSMLEDAVKEITAAGGLAVACKLDVTKEDDHKAAFEFAEKAYGGVNYVFANAGYIGLLEKPLENQTADEIMMPSMVNAKGMALSIKYGVISMRKNNPPGGSIVLCSSIGSLYSPDYMRSARPTGGLPYAMSKGATDVLARGLAAYEHEGIRGYGINPFMYESEMTTRDVSDKFGVEVKNLAAVNAIFNNIETPWLGFPEGTEKVAHVVLAMLEGRTTYMPGDSVICDGDATWNAQVAYNEITSQDAQSSMFGSSARKVWLASMKDYKGDSYDISQLPKMLQKGQNSDPVYLSDLTKQEKSDKAEL